MGVSGTSFVGFRSRFNSNMHIHMTFIYVHTSKSYVYRWQFSGFTLTKTVFTTHTFWHSHHPNAIYRASLWVDATVLSSEERPIDLSQLIWDVRLINVDQPRMCNRRMPNFTTYRVLVCISDSMLVLNRSKSKQWNVATITCCPGVFDATTHVL